jgi:glutamine synthetase adenylyltransferase
LSDAGRATRFGYDRRRCFRAAPNAPHGCGRGGAETDCKRNCSTRFAPTLADALQRAPDPDRLLVNCDRWLESLGATLTYYRLFAETPHALKPVLAVLGASDFMADTLLQNPELSEILLDVRLLTRPAHPRRYAPRP